MAGIGFQLRSMANEKGFSKVTGAYAYSLFLVAGPWVFTVLALLGITFAIRSTTTWTDVQVFRSIIIYNFCLTLILTGPVTLLVTRYLADQVYKRDTRFVPFAMLCALVVVAALTLLIAAPFFAVFTTLEPANVVLATINFGLVSAIWVASPFLSILKDYKNVSLSFLIGCVCATALAVLLAGVLDDVLILLVFNGALTVTLAVLVSRFSIEYSRGIEIDPSWRTFLAQRWQIGGFGLFYYLGIWIDKIIMWHSDQPGSLRVGDALATMPIYDAAMFMAQLGAIPAFVYFFVHVETGFFERFKALSDGAQKDASLRAIEAQIDRIGKFVFEQLIKILIALLLGAGLVILALPAIYESLALSEIQLGIFRIGLLGAAWHTMFLFCVTFLLYFDLRFPALVLAGLYFILNGALTIAFLPYGLAYYGMGYMIAGAISFLVAAAWLAREIPWLAYHTFVSNSGMRAH